MWWMIAVVLLIEWLVGLMSQYTIGGLIHILFLAAMAVIVITTVQDRKHSRRQLSFKARQAAAK